MLLPHQVSVGDQILVATADGELIYDTIALVVSHANVTKETYLRIATATRVLTLTPNHYMHASHGEPAVSCCSGSTLKLASDVSAGEGGLGWLGV